MRTSCFPLASACAALLFAGCRASEAALSVAVPGARELPEGAPLLVTADLTVKAGRYVRPPFGERGVVLLSGLTGVTLDLRGVELHAAAEDVAPEAARGRAIVLRDCTGVTVLGGSLTGYAQGLVIESSRDVVIDGLEVDGFFAERLRSTSAAPDEGDRLDTQGEHAETWLARYGAAIAVLDCSRVTVRNARARGGQNGLVLVRSESCLVYDCDFSFLSGWGVCLARANLCVVSHNRVESCARGWVEGRYAEPFGSAGLFLAGPSSGNVFAFNRAVRCGTGALVDGPSSEGAAGESEPNLWYRNDLSYAVGHSFEQRGGAASHVLSNRMLGSRGGGAVARGSSGLVLRENRIEEAVGAGVSIVDGRDALVVANELIGCDRGIELLRSTRELEPAAKTGELESSGHWVIDNRLEDNVQDLVLESSRGLVFGGNSFSSTAPKVHLDGLSGIGAARASAQDVWEWLRGTDGSLPSGRVWDTTLRRRPAEIHPGIAELERREPPAVPGASFPDFEPPDVGLALLVLGSYGPWDATRGGPPPELRPPGGLLEGLAWDSVWFRWDERSDPRGDVDLWRARRFDPISRALTTGWADPWSGAERRAAIGDERFGLIATATIEIEEHGRHALDVISDDGVRVLIDGQVVHEDWTWHSEHRAIVELDLEAGAHELCIEYFQVSGAAVLTVALERRADA